MENLQTVIRNRREERRLKAQEKRNEDLQCIMNLHSKDGINPLNIFPKEIWAKIFSELDPEDLNNIVKIHPLFRDLLEDSIVRDILLPLVLKLDTFQQKYLQQREMYYGQELRLISKSSRKSFDRFMEESLVKRLKENTQITWAESGENCVNINISDPYRMEMLTRLVTSFCGESENHIGHFFVKGLFVSFADYELHHETKERVMQLQEQVKMGISALLKRIGDQIWHFGFFVDAQTKNRFSFAETYKLFHGWIKFMPNIKWLYFSVDACDEDESAKEDVVKEHPFPLLNSLERLSIHIFNDPESQIQKAVIASNPQLKSLDLNFLDGEKHHFQVLPIQQIQSLQLTSISMSGSMNKSFQPNIPECISTIVNFNFPLKRITLNCDSVCGNMNSTFQFLGRFPTLENVELSCLKKISVGNTDSYGYLNLPNLISFYLKIYKPIIDYESNIHFFFSLQFLMLCKNLKSLHWIIDGVEDGKLREILKKHEDPKTGIDFRGGLRFLYDSNIWEVFPSLDILHSHLRKCRREGWGQKWVGFDFCSHTYKRMAKGQSVTQFLETHECSLRDDLKDCIIFHG